MAAAPRAIPVYFSLGTRKGVRVVVLPGHGAVRLAEASLDTARIIWERREPYYHITPAGARELYGDRNADSLQRLLPNCRTADEVAAIVKLRKSNKALQAAAIERLRELELQT